jgi:hypothetical protein
MAGAKSEAAVIGVGRAGGGSGDDPEMNSSPWLSRTFKRKASIGAAVRSRKLRQNLWEEMSRHQLLHTMAVRGGGSLGHQVGTRGGSPR